MVYVASGRNLNTSPCLDLFHSTLWCLVSFHDACISIAFTTLFVRPFIRHLQSKCNNNCHLRRWYSSTAYKSSFDISWPTLNVRDDDELQGWVPWSDDDITVSNVAGDQSTSDSFITNCLPIVCRAVCVVLMNRLFICCRRMYLSRRGVVALWRLRALPLTLIVAFPWTLDGAYIMYNWRHVEWAEAVVQHSIFQ